MSRRTGGRSATDLVLVVTPCNASSRSGRTFGAAVVEIVRRRTGLPESFADSDSEEGRRYGERVVVHPTDDEDRGELSRDSRARDFNPPCSATVLRELLEK